MDLNLKKKKIVHLKQQYIDLRNYLVWYRFQEMMAFQESLEEKDTQREKSFVKTLYLTKKWNGKDVKVD